MIEQIGRKIKAVSIFLFVLNVSLSVFFGVLIYYKNTIMISYAKNVTGGLYILLSSIIKSNEFQGLLFIFLGVFISFLSFIVLYGFGELIDKTAKNEKNTAEIKELLKQKNNQSPPSATEQSIER